MREGGLCAIGEVVVEGVGVIGEGVLVDGGVHGVEGG